MGGTLEPWSFPRASISGCGSKQAVSRSRLPGREPSHLSRPDGAYCSHLHQGFSVSLDDIEEMAEESALWVQGFLNGNEPGPADMFGPAIHQADESDPKWQRWRAAVAKFRDTGRWAPARWRQLPPTPPDIEGAPRAWTVIGDEYWSWDGHEWDPVSTPLGRRVNAASRYGLPYPRTP